MAITTMDQLVAGFKPFGEDIIKAGFTAKGSGALHSTLYVTGRPGAGATPAPGINGAALTSYAGTIPVPTPVTGQNIYIARLEFMQVFGVGGMAVCDRLWHNSGLSVTTTTAQSITFPGLPARDNNGTANGAGVMAALEVSTATTNGAIISNMTMSYTNELGVSGRTGTVGVNNNFPATAPAGTFIPFALQAGDYGVRSVQSVTLGTSLVSGAVHLVLYRELISIGTPSINVIASMGPLELGLPRVYDNSVLWPVYTPTSTTPGATNAQVSFAQG